MRLIRITSAMRRKILPIYPYYSHVEFIAMKRNEAGITIRYDTTLASEDFPLGCLLEIFKIKISANKRIYFPIGSRSYAK